MKIVVKMLLFFIVSAACCGAVGDKTFTGDLLPKTTATYDIGSVALLWNDVHAVTYYGSGLNLTGILEAEGGISNPLSTNIIADNDGNASGTINLQIGLPVVTMLEVTNAGDINITNTLTVTGPIVGDLTGNADTATALATGRTISMTGDVTYTSNAFDGTANVTGVGTIQADSVDDSHINWIDIDNLGEEGALVVADESVDTTCFPLFVTAATGSLAPKTGSNLIFNSFNGMLESTYYTNGTITLSGSAISGIVQLAGSDTVIILDTPTAGDVSIAGDLSAGGGTFTDVVTGITPTAGDHLATKEYVDLSLGTRDTYFLSDTASGVGALNTMFQHETTEAESTIVSAGLGEADNQLVKGYITEAGQPNSELINSGVIAFDVHAKKGANNQKATQLYCILSYVEADGTTDKTTIATSAITAELTDTETIYHIHASLAESVSIDITDRIILDVYANVGTGALDSVVTLYMEGVHDSHVDFEVSGGIWQNQGDVLDDLNTLGVVASDGQFIVGTGIGAFAYESGATVRTSLGLGTGDSPTFTTCDVTTDFTIGDTVITDGVITDTTGLSIVANTAITGTLGAGATTLSGNLDLGAGDITNISDLLLNTAGVIKFKIGRASCRERV